VQSTLHPYDLFRWIVLWNAIMHIAMAIAKGSCDRQRYVSRRADK
jgi:hypothetical protein